MARPRLLQLALISIVLGVSISLAWLFFQTIVRVGNESFVSNQPVLVNDFIAHYAGAKFAARGHLERAYDLDELHAIEKEITGNADLPVFAAAYPPFFYLLIMPLADLDMLSAYRLWVALTLFALMLVALRIEPHWQTLPLVPIFPAVTFCAAAGQNGILSAAVIGAGLLLLRNKPVTAGVAFGLMAYKPHLAVAIPFFLIGGGHWRTLLVTAATAIATVLLSVLAFGPAALLAFLSNIILHGTNDFGGPSYPVWQRMPTVLVSMLQLTDNRALAWTIYGLVAVAALAGLVRVWRCTQQSGLRALALTASMPLVTPYFFDYDLAVLVIPSTFLAREMRLSGMTWGRLLLLAALWATPPAVTMMPSNVYLPLAPAVWMLLLAYASWASSRAIHLRAGTT